MIRIEQARERQRLARPVRQPADRPSCLCRRFATRDEDRPLAWCGV